MFIICLYLGAAAKTATSEGYASRMCETVQSCGRQSIRPPHDTRCKLRIQTVCYSFTTPYIERFHHIYGEIKTPHFTYEYMCWRAEVTTVEG
jgi:hypothetical protein